MRIVLSLAAVALLCFVATRSAGAADQAKPAAVAPVDPVITIGEMRVQTVPAMTYLHLPVETSFDKMGEPVREAFDKVFTAAVEAKLIVVRPTMMIYSGNPHFDPAKPFKVDVGVVVAEGTEAIGECKVRKTEPFKCATILYTGPVMEQGKAYQKLIPALMAAGHQPTGEEREMCLYWEGAESSNNVFIMQIGIK